MTIPHALPDRTDVAVIGGGLAGLTAATSAALTGARVTLFEARTEPGGRGRSDEMAGAAVNRGAHALYLGGAAAPILRELGVRWSGRIPMQRGLSWLVDGERIPARRMRALGGLAAATATLRMARRSGEPGDHGDDAAQSIGAWMDEHVDDRARRFADFAVRITSYVADTSTFDAAAARAQIRRAVRGVHYLDGGWNVLVDGLRDAALAAGVTIVHDKVTAIETTAAGHRVGRSDGAVTARSIVVAAGGPGHADRLLGGQSPTVAGWAAAADPVRAYCLDLVFDGLPRPRRSTMFGLGTPAYLVDASRTARLGPPGRHVVHGLVYEPDRLPAGSAPPRQILETMLDLQQPGWRDHVLDSIERSSLVVAHDRPRPGATPATEGVPDLDGVWVAGDWVFTDGLLADAAIGSGRRAGLAAARHAAHHSTTHSAPSATPTRLAPA